jgi:multidrug efflux pump subunit AcrA (membrane-fusion protein)
MSRIGFQGMERDVPVSGSTVGVVSTDEEELTVPAAPEPVEDAEFTTMRPSSVSAVSATGVVTSKVDLDLSFKKAGTVKSVNFDVGDKVKKGQILATLSAGSKGASVSQARAGVALAEAKLQKIKEGATSEEITLAKVALNNAKTDLNTTTNTQNTLVSNAYSKLLNSISGNNVCSENPILKLPC